MAWLPLAELRPHHVQNIKRELTIQPKKTTDIQTKKDPDPIFLWEEDLDRGMLGVPRGYYEQRKSSSHKEILDVSYGVPMRELETSFSAEGPFAEQEQAISRIMLEFEDRQWGGALLRADAGWGKTFMSVEFARRLGRRTLILVHKDFLLNQWKRAIESMMPDARVGIIKQSKGEFDQLEKTGESPDFVIGLLQSLSRDDGFKYSDDLYRSFGLIIGDEIHRVGANSWAGIIPRFNAAWRLGISATPTRKDGAQDVFFSHISQITYSATAKMMKPKLRMIRTTATLRRISRGSYSVSVSNLNSAQIINQLAADNMRTRDIVDDLVLAVKNGRKVMVVSKRLSHLKEMSDSLAGILFNMDLGFSPKIDFYTSDWYTGEQWTETKRGKGGKILHRKGDPKFRKRSERDLREAESANILFCTHQMMCVDGENVVVDSKTGKPFFVKDLVDNEDGVSLLSFNEENGTFEHDSVVRAWKTGKKEVLKIRFGRGGKRSNKHVSVSKDHLIMTQRGYVDAEDLKIGDWVMSPGICPRCEDQCDDILIDTDEALLLGYFIGDGNVSHVDSMNAGFFNIDPDVIFEVNRLLGKYGASLVPKRSHGEDIQGKYRVKFNGNDSFRSLMMLHEVNGCRAWEKTLSSRLICADREVAGALIAGLIVSDGSVSKKQVMVSHSSSSRELAYQMQNILLRNGIYSHVYQIKPGRGCRRMTYWLVSVSGLFWIGKLRDFIGKYLSPTKRNALEKICNFKRTEDGPFTRIPEEMLVYAIRVMRHHGNFVGNSLKRSDTFLYGKQYRNGASVRDVKKIAELTGDKLLKEWTSGEVLWDRVSHVENIGTRDVYDIEMSKNHNFVCNGVVVHNCEGLSIPACDVLVMATPESELEQLVGRIQRWCFPEEKKCERLCPWRAGKCRGKPQPIVVDVVDEEIPRMISKFNRRKRFYRKTGMI